MKLLTTLVAAILVVQLVYCDVTITSNAIDCGGADSLPQYRKPLSITITLTPSLEGRTVRYTTDDTPVTESSPVYTEPFTLSTLGYHTINANEWDGVTPATESSLLVMVTWHSLPSTTVDVGTNIVLSFAPEYDHVRYTTNGVDATPDDTVYDAQNPFHIPTAGTTTLKVLGIAPTTSACAADRYTWDLTVQPLLLQVDTFTEYVVATNLSINASVDSTIKYTTDGSDPTLAVGTELGANLTIVPEESPYTFKFRCIKNGEMSDVVSRTYTVVTPPGAVTIADLVEGQEYAKSVDLTMSSDGTGDAIYFSFTYQPDYNLRAYQILYNTTLTVDLAYAGKSDTSNIVIYAQAVKLYDTPRVRTWGPLTTLNIKLVKELEVRAVVNPAIDYFNTVSPTFTTLESGSTIYCTTDGTEPTESSPLCSALGAISTVGTHVIKAKAWKLTASGSVYTFTYKIYTTPDAVAVAGPTGNGTQYSLAGTFTLSCSNAHDAIFFTIDDSVPTTSSAKYTGPLTGSSVGTFILRAIAFKNGSTPISSSPIRYVVSLIEKGTITSSPANETSQVTTIQLTLSTIDPTSSIYYSFGSDTSMNIPYTAPITLTKTEVSEPATGKVIVHAVVFIGTEEQTVRKFIFYVLDTVPAALALEDTQISNDSTVYFNYDSVSGAHSKVIKFYSQNKYLQDVDVIYYTLDGTAPTLSSPVYDKTNGIVRTTTGSVTMKAFVVRGTSTGSVNTFIFNFAHPTPAAVTVFPQTNSTHKDGQLRIEISANEQNGAYKTLNYSIYYSINGSDPTDTINNGTYSGMFNVSAGIIGPITFKAVAYKFNVAGPVVTVNYTIEAIEPPKQCNPTCVHGHCDPTLAVPVCVCDTEWKGVDCTTPDQGDLVIEIDNDTAVIAAVSVAVVGLVAVFFIAKKKISRKEPTEDEFVLVNAESKNDSPKLPSVYARIKANPDFVFAIEYEKTVIGRYHREEHVDLDLSSFPTVDMQRLSRKHAVINLVKDGPTGECFMITNYGKHGITVDGVKITGEDTAVLYNKSLIRICGAMLVFRDDVHKNMELPPDVLKANMKMARAHTKPAPTSAPAQDIPSELKNDDDQQPMAANAEDENKHDTGSDDDGPVTAPAPKKDDLALEDVKEMN